MKRIKESALNEKARKYAQDFGLTINDNMAIIVQKMVDGGHKGIIYSKFPASVNITKIISWFKDEEGQIITLLRRIVSDGVKGLLYKIKPKNT